MANAKASSKTKTRTKTLPSTKRPNAVKTQALDKAGEQLERAQAAAVESKQPRFAVTRQQAVNLFNQIYGIAKEAIFNEPPYAADSTRLDTWLAKVVKKEPYLLGILQSVVSIDKNRGWTLVGGKIQVKKFVNILHNFQVAPDLFGWRNGLSVSAQNFYQANLGAVVEIGRSQPNGPLAALYTVDPTKCRLTGRQEAPLKYNNGPRDKQYWEPTDYFRVTSFPSPMETMNGLGMCAVYRCIELAKLLVSIFEHDREQLGSKAPKGILTINGVPQSQWLQSLEESSADLKTLEREYYSGVQVLASEGNPEIKVNLTSFSNLPAQFDHRQFVDMMIYGYALAFGYDPREFWPVSSGALGTATESESQHRRASSKGGLDFVLGFQERLQDELPETVEFEFEQRDVQGDIAEADFKKNQLDIIEDMFTKENSKQENAITLPEARQLMVEAKLIPDDWTPGDEDIQVEDTKDLGPLVEKQRVQRAIAKFPTEQIVVYNDRTKQTHVIYDPNNRKFAMRVVKPAVIETPAPVVQLAPVVDMTPVLDVLNERFAELKRETPAPAMPVFVQQAESPSWLESFVARLTNQPAAAGIDTKSFDTMARSVGDLAIYVKDLQGANQKHSERDLRSVADALNNLAIRSIQQTPAPDVNITMSPITLHAQMPKGNDPIVNFSPTIHPSDVVIRENTPVNVTVQPAAAPVNNITVKPADVKIPKPVRELQKINRDTQDLIESTETEITYKD